MTQPEMQAEAKRVIHLKLHMLERVKERRDAQAKSNDDQERKKA